jgi:hypothetical protein
MDIIKTCFDAIRDQLKAEVPEIVWIDEENGQLTEFEEPPLQFPCALIDTQGVQFNGTEDLHSSANTKVTVQFGFKTYEATNHLVPNSNAFAYSAILEKAINALHGLEPDNSRGFTKEGYMRIKRAGIKVYEVTFDISFFGRAV